VSFLFKNGGNTREGRDRNLDVILSKKVSLVFTQPKMKKGAKKKAK
jgi:hypothetical protein